MFPPPSEIGKASDHSKARFPIGGRVFLLSGGQAEEDEVAVYGFAGCIGQGAG